MFNQKPTGVCPVCNGTKREPVQEDLRGQNWLKTNKSYDETTHTRNCYNCSPKGMFVNGEPKGIVPLDRDGNPCKHRFEETQLGRCWYSYKCANGCGESYQIDSGD